MYRILNYGSGSSNSEYANGSFSIVLTQKWKRVVEQSYLNQDRINDMLGRIEERILKLHGYQGLSNEFRITWGEWGPEHITVLGNACGVDIETGGFGYEEDEAILNPHNVDSIIQASMILSLFVYIANYLEIEEQMRKYEETEKII